MADHVRLGPEDIDCGLAHGAEHGISPVSESLPKSLGATCRTHRTASCGDSRIHRREMRGCGRPRLTWVSCGGPRQSMGRPDNIALKADGHAPCLRKGRARGLRQRSADKIEEKAYVVGA